MKFPAHISESGKLIIQGQRRFDNEVMIHAGKDVVVTIERKKSKRSIQQNRFYFGPVLDVIYDGFIDMGFRKDEISKEKIHEMMKMQFLTKEIGSETGLFIKTVGSTTELSKSEFSDFIEQISAWAVEFLNVRIPEANEQFEMQVS